MTKKAASLARDRAQQQRFIEAAREAGCSEDEAETVENLKRVFTAKPNKAPEKE